MKPSEAFQLCVFIVGIIIIIIGDVSTFVYNGSSCLMITYQTVSWICTIVSILLLILILIEMIGDWLDKADEEYEKN